jgi:penicillin-binding protein 2
MSFGFGKYFESDLSNHSRGNIPSEKYYDRYYGRNGWKSLTIRSLAIGQGEILITPLQLANQAVVLSNRGFYYPPHVVKSIGTTATAWKKEVSLVEPKNIEPIITGMYNVFQGAHGTARWAQIDSIEACGKTGTVQNPHGKDHSLFVAFAPAKNPKIAISVVIENAGFGSTWAVPIASLMMELYLTRAIKRTDLEERMINADFSSIKPEIED